MPRVKATALARLIKERRSNLGLSQRELARRIRTSPGYISQLELGKRHPTYTRVALLADALKVDKRELFWVANPKAREIVNTPPNRDALSAWEQFRNDRLLRRSYRILNDEMQLLSCIAALGEVRSAREFIFILNAVRQAVGR